MNEICALAGFAVVMMLCGVLDDAVAVTRGATRVGGDLMDGKRNP